MCLNIFHSFLLAFAVYPTVPHILENGFVERSLSIVIRNGKAYGEYQIGLNNQTMNDLASGWHSGKPANDVLPKTAEQKDVSLTEEGKGDSDSKLSTKEKTQERPQIRQANSDDALSQQSDEKGKAKPSVAQSEDNETSNHWLDPEALKEFRETFKSRIGKHLKVSCEGKPVEIKALEFGPPPRHPFYISVKFQFELPDSGAYELDVVDEGFLSSDGAIRFALKGLGNHMVLRSNVAPTIIRAKRIDLGELEPDEQKEANKISARIGIAGTTKDTK